MEVHRLYAAYRVTELRELLAVRGVALETGYTKKDQLIKMAMDSSPAEMQYLSQLGSDLMGDGIEVKWRSRMLATGSSMRMALNTTAERVNSLLERWSVQPDAEGR